MPATPAVPEIYSRYKIPQEVIVEIDSREQYPVLFPSTIKIPHPERTLRRTLAIKVKTQKIKLDYGDYRLAEYPDCCVVERKASQFELLKNLLDPIDSVRQARAFRRLSACEHPYILIEASPSELCSRNKMVKEPERIIAALSLVLAKYRFGVLWLPWRSRSPSTRRKTGTVLIHLMLAYAIQPTLDIMPDLMYDYDS